MQRGFQRFCRTEMVGLQQLFVPAVEPLDPLPGSALEMHERDAIRLGVLRRGQTVFDAQIRAQRIKLVLAGCRAFTQAEQAAGELLAIIRQDGADANRTGPLQIAQEPAGIGCRFGLGDADEDPTGGAVDCHE